MISLRGLYVITDRHLIDPTHFIETVEQAIWGGAKIIQYRDKSGPHRLEQARALHQLCQHYQIPLIINDDPSLVQSVGAEGIHLGQEDAQISEVRAILKKEVIIGISCYNQLSLAHQAVAAGASYVAFGSFFTSPTKPKAVRANLELLREARRQLTCPIVAIGGITPQNGAELVAAGADCLAVIHGLFGQPEVTAAAQQYTRLFETQSWR